MEELTFEGIYIGRDYEEGLKPNGAKWQRYTLRFKPQGQQQFGTQFTVFMPILDMTSLTIDKLVEGKYYKVVYGLSSKINPKSGKPYKQFLRINEATPQAQPQTTSQIDMSKWDNFKEKYFAAMEKQKTQPTVSQMVGSFLMTYAPKQVEQVVTMANVAITARESNKPQ